MTPVPIEVAVALPFDGVTGIVIPAAAVLVSAGIAIWLARGERRAAERDRVGAAASRVVRSLTELTSAAGQEDLAAVERADVAFQGDLNEFSVALDARDADLPKFLAGVLARSYRQGGFEVIARTASFLVGCVEGWVRGRLTTAAFTADMPPDADDVWTSTVRPGDWERVSTAAPAPVTGSAPDTASAAGAAPRSDPPSETGPE